MAAVSSGPVPPLRPSSPASVASAETQNTVAAQSRWKAKLKTTSDVVLTHATKHTGVGVVCAVAYFDPGNWGVDLQAGSEYGYKLLFVVLLAGLIAVYWQILASRLGCVTGLDLASHCRLLLYNRPKYTRAWRWFALYPLYALSEIAIVCTDLAELLGSAIALCMLFPRIPLWGGVLLTAGDVLILLAIGDPLRGRPVKVFEWIIAGMVLAVLVCMAIIVGRIGPDWADVFHGFVPSKQIFQSGGLYISVGIIGATVMPHSLFLGSALATQDRISAAPNDTQSLYSLGGDTLAERPCRGPWQRVAHAVTDIFRVRRVERDLDNATRHAEHENRGFAFVRAHIYHGIADVVVSLLGFAVIINSFILILAGAVFYYGSVESGGPAGLFDAYDLIKDLVGQGAATLFAVALLFSGQSATIVATVAGQVVSEGYIRWSVPPFMRRLLTRLLGLIPSLAVAIAVGRAGIDSLLVVSQVALSIALPFVTLPLLILTSSDAVMSVRRPREVAQRAPPLGEVLAVGSHHAVVDEKEDAKEEPSPVVPSSRSIEHTGDDAEEVVSYANSKPVMLFGCVLWILVVIANVYVLVTLGMGKSGGH